MKNPLFKPLGWIYYPVSITGWIITVIIGAVFIHDLIFINSKAHSVSDVYYGFLPYGGVYILVYLWIAFRSSRKI